MVSWTILPRAAWMLLLVMIGVSNPQSGKLSKSRNIYLGLYSGNDSDTLRVYNKPTDSLLCYDFTPDNSTTEQCKFYGDCCVDPMRIRDRLEPGTFSCQTTPGYTGELVYVVDKCPNLTEDKKLVNACLHTQTGSSFSMATWPVTAKRTGLLYKNIFCALCHGVVTERDIPVNSTEYSKSVDFWWLSVNCEVSTIRKLTEEYEKFTFEYLEPFIHNGDCGLRFSPPSQPHRCLDAVRSCPDNFTDVERKLLCQQGPVSYTRGEDGEMYRNYFCQLCHAQNDDVVDCGPEAHTGMNGTLTSPNYPNNYPNNAYCNWTITLPLGERIGIRLLNFELEHGDSCEYDNLTFYDLATGAHLDTLCGSGVRYVEGNSSSVLVVFSADKQFTSSGFVLEWADVVDCGPEAHTGLNGTLTSPNYPNNYPNNAYCYWTITLPLGERIGIRLLNFELEWEENCNIDSLRFYDLATGEYLDTLCGSGVRYVEGNSSSVEVVFSTDEQFTFSGFVLEWAASSCEFMGYMCSDGGCELGSDEIPDLPCEGGTRQICCPRIVPGIASSSSSDVVDCGPEARTGMNGTLTSPNYPNNYPNNAYCNWTITLPLGGRIGIRLNFLDIEGEDDCPYDYLEFYDLTTFTHLDTICGSGVRYVDGNSSSVLVVFSTDDIGAYSGFELEWAASSCEFMGYTCSDGGCELVSDEIPELPCDGGTSETCCAWNGNINSDVFDCGPEAHTGMNGTLTSPNYPNNYPNNTYCNWTITLPLGGRIGIRLNFLDIEGEDDCPDDHLEFYDPTTWTHLDTFCKTRVRFVEGNSSSVLVIFRTDGKGAYSGFELEWAASSCEFMGYLCSDGGCELGSIEIPDLPCGGGAGETCCAQNGSQWPHSLIEIRPQVQKQLHKDLSLDDYMTNSESYNTSVKRLALTNNILDSYEYSVIAFNPPTNSSWNFGSLLCESLYKGICDKLITRPRSGCGGPGCGVNSWQDASSTCYKLSNYNYDLSSRQQAEYIWPHSLYGRYSSSCNPEAGVHPVWWGVNCRCDSRCHYFDECCFDTALPENYIHHQQTLKYSCVAQPSCETRYSFAIISTCPTGSDFILGQLCTQGEIGDWSPVGWTVYDSKTNLSYKNVYCALCNDVPAERVKFWQAYFECHKNETTKMNATEGENINNLEWQGECSFIRFIPKEPEIAYTCYNPPIVSSCPRHLADWKIAYDCVNEPTSWVSNNQTLYRNAYCAICNLDDEIMESTIGPTEAYFKLNARAAESLFGDEIYRPPDSVILDVSENKCCYRDECMLNTHSSSEQSPWGKIGQGNSSKCLMRLPFDTSCEDNSFVSPDRKLPNLFYLCSGSFQPFPDGFHGCDGSPGPSGGLHPITPSFAKLIFTDFGDIPLTNTFISDTEWIEVNDSLFLCSNGTNLITTTGELYSKLRLSPSKIEVKQKFITETFDGPSLESYDYILLSLSLLSLGVYIIYILSNKKERSLNLPEMMKLSSLLSLFGALLCYSLANIPAGKDLIGCKALAAMQQFLFLSSFTWTSAFGINITQLIYTIQPSSSRTKRFLWFAAYAVGLPITMVMTTFSLSEFQENIVAFKSPVYRVYGICFLHETYIIIALFLAPIYIIVASNVIVCVMCMVRVSKTSGITTHDKDRWKKNILTCIKLSVCMGLAWILLFFVPLGSQSLDLGFKVLVEIQGLLIVAVNVISWECIRKARKYTVSWTSTTAVTSAAVSGIQSVELSNRPTSDQPQV